MHFLAKLPEFFIDLFKTLNLNVIFVLQSNKNVQKVFIYEFHFLLL